MTDCDNCIHHSLCETLDVLYMDQCPEYFSENELKSAYVKKIATKLKDHFGIGFYNQRCRSVIENALNELESE